jgi:hypothetical protein
VIDAKVPSKITGVIPGNVSIINLKIR